jgi:hypothetical protein
MSLFVSGRFDTPGGVGSRSRALTILERVAEETIDAQQCEEGSTPAELAALFHGIFPGLTADALGAVDRLLPGPGGVGSRSVKGRDSTSALSPSWATRLSDQAALANNETIENGYHPHAS